VLSTQILSLTGDLQTYRENLVDKARSISSLGRGTSTLQKATDAVEALDQAIRQEFEAPQPSTQSGVSTVPPAGSAEAPQKDGAQGEGGMGLGTLLERAAGPGTTFALTLLFTMFLLLQYEDIRDRVIRLAGTDNISGTTAAMSDAGSRLSKLFLTQAVLNAGFGVVTGVVLALLGVPNPILWGAVGAVARFIPYIGSIIAAVPPVILAAGVDPGWGLALATAAYFFISEPVMGHVVEPAILGRSIGLSPFAMVIAASFWVLIWGPIGLLLAAPLTMLVVVLGAYIPRLEFASVLLGDERALEPHLDLYRRILSGDTASSIAQIEEEIEEFGLNASVDRSLLPALRHAAADQRRGRIDAERQTEVAETVTDIVEFLTDTVPSPPPPSGRAQRVLVVPARGPFDELTAKVAAAVLDKSPRIAAEAATGSSGLSALVLRLAEDEAEAPDAIVIATAGGMERRLLSILARRTATQFPQARVSILEAVEPGLGRDSAALIEGVPHWRTAAEALSALDFEPTRRAETADAA
jgi:predicted PurR-regulated permease PerM